MCRHVCLAALLLIPAAASAQDAYTLTVRPLGKGDIVQTEMESRTRVGAVKVNGRGQTVLDHKALTVGRLAFTDTILDPGAGAERTRRHYSRATLDSDGREATQPLHGRTVVIVRKGGAADVLDERGEPLPREVGAQLAGQYNAPAAGEVRWEEMLPRGPVQVGATWDLDPRRWGRPEIEFRTGTAVGKLTKVYRQGSVLCATVEFTVDIPLTGMTVQGRRLDLQPGSRLASRTTVDLCINGTSSWRVERGTSGMVTHIHAAGGDGLDTRMDYESEITYASSCRPAP